MSYVPQNLSFRALTVLVAHAESGGECRFTVSDSLKITVQSLIRNGDLRMKNSSTTMITRHGHDRLCKALAQWADLLTRFPGAIVDARHKQLAAEAMARRRSDEVADRRGPALPEEPAHSL